MEKYNQTDPLALFVIIYVKIRDSIVNDQIDNFLQKMSMNEKIEKININLHIEANLSNTVSRAK